MKAFENMNDQMKAFTDMQAKSLEPMRVFGSLAVNALEQVARKNYEVAGEVVDFAVKQAQLPLSGQSANDIVSAQMAEAKSFGEAMNGRSSEYVELANELGAQALAAADEAAAAVKAAAAA